MIFSIQNLRLNSADRPSHRFIEYSFSADQPCSSYLHRPCSLILPVRALKSTPFLIGVEDPSPLGSYSGKTKNEELFYFLEIKLILITLIL